MQISPEPALLHDLELATLEPCWPRGRHATRASSKTIYVLGPPQRHPQRPDQKPVSSRSLPCWHSETSQHGSPMRSAVDPELLGQRDISGTALHSSMHTIHAITLLNPCNYYLHVHVIPRKKVLGLAPENHLGLPLVKAGPVLGLTIFAPTAVAMFS